MDAVLEVLTLLIKYIVLFFQFRFVVYSTGNMAGILFQCPSYILVHVTGMPYVPAFTIANRGGGGTFFIIM